MFDLGSTAAAAHPAVGNDPELLNFSASPQSSNTRDSDLLHGFLDSSAIEPQKTTAVQLESSSSNSFFSLDPFAPLGGGNKGPSTPSNNLTSSSSFSNFGTTCQQSQPINDSLMSDWDPMSILKQTPSGSSLPLHTPSISRNSSTPNLEAKFKDPLADFGNFTTLTGQVSSSSGVNPSPWNSATKPNPPINIGNFFFVFIFRCDFFLLNGFLICI